MTHAGKYMMDVKFAVERFRSSLFFSNKMPADTARRRCPMIIGMQY